MKGLDNLVSQLDGLQKALEGLDGELGSVSFDPHDPGSIEAAIQQMEAEIDVRVGAHSGNEMVSGIVDEMKEGFRQQILDRAAAARLKGGDDPS